MDNETVENLHRGGKKEGGVSEELRVEKNVELRD